MAAWRQSSGQRSLDSKPVLTIGYDDDGEKYGGKTLEKLLISANIEGAVCVARWFGGIMLGPVRFDHMRNCAQEAITNCAQAAEVTNKRKKAQDEAEKKAKLVRALPERDQSIVVLRGLLAEKTKSSSPQDAVTKRSPAKAPDYSSLPLDALKRLEKARDATISWILQGIEKAEKEQANDKADGGPSSSKAESSSGMVKPAEEGTESVVLELKPKGHKEAI